MRIRATSNARRIHVLRLTPPTPLVLYSLGTGNDAVGADQDEGTPAVHEGLPLPLVALPLLPEDLVPQEVPGLMDERQKGPRAEGTFRKTFFVSDR